MEEQRLRLGIVGCGDVAYRHYLPSLEDVANLASVVALADPRDGAAQAMAEAIASWSPGARAYGDVESMLRAAEPGGELASGGGLDGVIDLTPAPLHGRINRAILGSGIACYSEKPLASTIGEANELIALAREQGTLFLCAPGSAVTERVRWLSTLARDGRLGTITLAVAHHADPGPAAWPEYTGDPSPFYREGVGPVFDHGIYRLHELTTVIGPIRRVEAMGTIAIPRRVVRGGPLRGRTIEVTTPDHVLIGLEFASGALGQLLASFATADTLQPWLELHFERGVVSFGGKSWEMDAPVSIFEADDAHPEREGWHTAEVPPDPIGTVEAGARHFVRCLAGVEAPVLSAEQARHVLEVILAAYESIRDGRAHLIETTF